MLGGRLDPVIPYATEVPGLAGYCHQVSNVSSTAQTPAKAKLLGEMA